MREVGMKKLSIIAVMTLLYLQFAYAEDSDVAEVKKKLSSIMPNATPDSVAESVIPGVYEAIYGAQVVYISKDGRYMMEGEIYDLQSRVNLTETKRQNGRLKAVSSMDKSSMIVFSPEKTTTKAKHVITAFTDIDCGYCRKLHTQIKEYNDEGIEVRYAAFPRSGPQTPSYFKAVAVWCAVDRNKAMSFAKGGASLEQLQQLEQVKDNSCKDTVKQHMATAREIGVTGTPTLVMENGEVIPGYVPPDRLIKILDEKDKRG